MNIDELLVALCNEPFDLDIDRAGRLTLFQLRKLYFRKRVKETGQVELVFDDPPPAPTFEQKVWMLGIPMWYAEKLYKR